MKTHKYGKIDIIFILPSENRAMRYNFRGNKKIKGNFYNKLIFDNQDSMIRLRKPALLPYWMNLFIRKRKQTSSYSFSLYIIPMLKYLFQFIFLSFKTIFTEHFIILSMYL